MQRMWEVVFEYVLYRIDGGLRLNLANNGEAQAQAGTGQLKMENITKLAKP